MSTLPAFPDIDFPPLVEALAHQGITQPTEVQLQAIEAILDGADTLVCAPTGSGKTLAFLLPVLQNLQTQKGRRKTIRALILSPTRELARQIVSEARKLCDRESVNVVALTGGDHRQTQQTFVDEADVLVATPGRLADLVGERSVDLSHIEYLVVDEADRTLDMGFAQVVTQIAMACNPERQTLLFSATVHSGDVRDFVAALTDGEKHREINVQAVVDHRVHRKVLVDDPQHVAHLLPPLLTQQTFTRAIVFTNKRERADQLCQSLIDAGEPASVLHGEMDAGRRKQVHRDFASGRARILVATDLAARGLDIEGVDLVINAELPFNVPSFIHRAGRTGRMERAGTVISLVSAHTWDRMSAIEHSLGLTAKPLAVAGFEANFKGPKKLKSSGKTSGRKKSSGKKTAPKKPTHNKAQPKQRQRDRKNIGKRRRPADKPEG